jgi:hypothetical protein
MFINWFKPYSFKIQEPKSMWEYSEKPVFKKEHRETTEICSDILKKIDELKALVDEIKEKENY